MEWVVVGAIVAYLGLVALVAQANRALGKALDVQAASVKALERLGKAAMDRILILKDYQAYTLLKKDAKPAARPRRTETRKV